MTIVSKFKSANSNAMNESYGITICFKFDYWTNKSNILSKKRPLCFHFILLGEDVKKACSSSYHVEVENLPTAKKARGKTHIPMHKMLRNHAI